MQNKKVQEAYKSYFIFNNQRTLSTDLLSELVIKESPCITTYIDKTRRYDNQIIIKDICDEDILANSLMLFDSNLSPEICVEPKASSPEINTWLTDHGFIRTFEHEFLQIENLSAIDIKSTADTIRVERLEESNADAFLALLKTSGLQCSDNIWLQKRSLYCTDTFRCYVALIDGKPCAWATSFIDGDYAILANAFTQEEYRGKGCQTALLSSRIKDAIENDVKVLLTDVEANSISGRNCQSFGFSSVGVRSVWCRKRVE
ncbi:GNAT family N-acetyltransferase [Veronia pacifica]|uniref:Acetyltransferase n=1 Tax=Veronia pacifica TaxID=1080227 RepID=A0A1C3ED36_9GAMM|nr:GNAT family N-acetyltransferase [Veronia pacifica]ODA31141.1 acetyltransferase [Veronia pacifica]